MNLTTEPAVDSLCPHCTYNLRGIASDRCPECGQPVDHDSLRTSGVAWAHRASLGRLRAFVRTLRLMLVGSRHLLVEHVRPQRWRDARGFGRLVLVMLAPLPPLTLWLALHAADGVAGIVLQRPALGGLTGDLGLAIDLLLPWSAGVALGWVLPACVLGWTWHALRLPRGMYDARRISDDQRQRGWALATYANAPLVLLWLFVPLATIEWLAMLNGEWFTVNLFKDEQLALIRWIGLAAIGGVCLTVIFRHGRWFARITQGPAGSGLRASVRLLFSIVLATLFWLGVVPWSVGLIWTAIDSLRA